MTDLESSLSALRVLLSWDPAVATEAAPYLDRLAAQIPQPARVSARHRHLPLYLHACDHTEPFAEPPTTSSFCPYCESPGPWRPLYIVGEEW